MKDTRLYIADQLVDLDSESIITMNYALEETNNPTIVKNSFSKSISLPATENNNALFGHIYELSRETIIDNTKMVGVYFNTLKRTPFQLFIEGELVESGYVQLTNISNINGVPRYTIQAYGGLGDFLYNLMYDEEGEKRTLASLNFGVEGYVGEAKDELDFVISKDVVNEAWAHLPRSERNGRNEIITFVPAYNGVGKDFDSAHALINYAGLSNANLPTSYSKDGKTYAPINGYGLLELPRSIDEAEARDMRSYLQRPALSVRSLIEACAKPENNGGYSVTLDPTFFKEENSLYHDAYITLPMLGSDAESSVSVESLNVSPDYVGGAVNRFVREIAIGEYNVSSLPINANVKINIPLSVYLEDISREELHTSIDIYKYQEVDHGGNVTIGGYVYKQTMSSAIVAQLLVYDDNRNIIAASNELALSDDGKFAKSWKVYRKLDIDDRGIANIKGYFQRKGDRLEFISEDNNNIFPLEVSCLRGNNQSLSVMLRVQRAFKADYTNISTDASALFTSKNAYIDDPILGVTIDNFVANGNMLIVASANGTKEVSTANLPSISSGMKITKDILLGATESPADYLLSYIKLFGLRIIKDVTNKSIEITSRYFTGGVVDLSDRIDRGQAMNITPNVFDKKFMRMGLEQPDTYFSTKYSGAHKLAYGQKRIDTGFAFNNETEEIYDGNVFTSAVPCLAASKFFNTYKNVNGVEMYNVLADNPKLMLATGNTASGYSTYGEDIVSAKYIDPAKTISFNATKGYDLMPKMCYFTMSEDVREGADIANNIVIFNRNVPLVNSAGEAVSYWLTDDIVEMIHLNGQNCYLLTMNENDAGENKVAIKRSTLPLFLSMRLTSDDVVLDSLDFAKGKEHYIPGINYPEGVSLYDKYWSSLYADRMHVDTRKVSCYANLSGLVVNGEALRSFYYFDNCYWLLNKIEDYDPTTERLTKCEFIRVQNRAAYYTPGDVEATIITDDVE